MGRRPGTDRIGNDVGESDPVRWRMVALSLTRSALLPAARTAVNAPHVDPLASADGIPASPRYYRRSLSWRRRRSAPQACSLAQHAPRPVLGAGWRP
jgi:hypothetical protein